MTPMPGKPFLSSVLAPLAAAAATGCRTHPRADAAPAPGRVKVFVAVRFQKHLSHVAATPR